MARLLYKKGLYLLSNIVGVHVLTLSSLQWPFSEWNQAKKITVIYACSVSDPDPKHLFMAWPVLFW